MGQKLQNAPVYFTVCQVQHNPLLSLDFLVPQIQENLRKSGYPDFRPARQMTFNLGVSVAPEGSLVQPPSPLAINQYHFSNAQNTSGFVLLPNALAFQTTAYDTFEIFSRELNRGLEILLAAVGELSYTERLGLRYLNAVAPSQGEGIGSYLTNEVLGLPAKMTDQKFAYSFSESLLTAGDMGQVVARAISQNGTLSFPPDLNGTLLKMIDRFRSITGEHAVVDIDGSHTERKPFDLNALQRSLTGIHGLAEKVFESMTTDHARKIWAQEGK